MNFFVILPEISCIILLKAERPQQQSSTAEKNGIIELMSKYIKTITKSDNTAWRIEQKCTEFL